MTSLQDMIAQHWEKRAAGGEYAQHFKAKMQAHGLDPKKLNEAPKAKVKAAFESVDKGWKGTKEASSDEEILAHVKEAYAVNGILPPGYEGAFFAMEKQALLGQVLKGVERFGDKTITRAGNKAIKAGFRQTGKTLQNVGGYIGDNPGKALALGTTAVAAPTVGFGAKKLMGGREG
jgi:hypothetical protein